MAKIWIYSDSPPSYFTTSGIVLAKIFELLSDKHDLEFKIIGIEKNNKIITAPFLATSSFTFFESPIDNWGFGPLTALYSRIIAPYVNKDLKKIQDYFDKEFSRDLPDHQIFVLQSETSIFLCDKYREYTANYTTVNWDPWNWWSRSHKVPLRRSAAINDALTRIFSKGFHFVPNKNWSSFYSSSHATWQDIYLPLKLVELSPVEYFSDLSEINLCFAGGLYAHNELDAFVTFLEHRNWVLLGRKVKLHFYGNGCPFDSPNIIFHGFLENTRLIETMSKHSFAILPYPSESVNSDISIFSFPSKYLTYLAARLPVIYIGPGNAAVCKFTNFTGFGIHPDSLESHFESNLDKLIESRASFISSIEEVHSEHFSLKVFQEAIREWNATIFPDEELQFFATKDARLFHLKTHQVKDLVVVSRNFTAFINILSFTAFINILRRIGWKIGSRYLRKGIDLATRIIMNAYRFFGH